MRWQTACTWCGQPIPDAAEWKPAGEPLGCVEHMNQEPEKE